MALPRELALRTTCNRDDYSRVLLLAVVGACEVVIADPTMLDAVCDWVFHPDLEHLAVELNVAAEIRVVLSQACGIDDVRLSDASRAVLVADKVKQLALAAFKALPPRTADYPFLFESRVHLEQHDVG